MWLYHATYRTNLKSIRELGLGAKQKKNWDISLDNVVCFARDPIDAHDFCSCNEEVSDRVYNSGIIVFAVNSKDIGKLEKDPNLHDIKSYIYRGIVPSDKLYVITDEGGLLGKLIDLKRVPAFFKNNF